MLNKAVVFLAVIGVCYAAVALTKPDEKPDKFKDVEGCYLKELDSVIPFGERAPSKNSCVEYSCGKDLVQIFSCGAVHADPPCKIVTRDNVQENPYPKCCPTIEC